MSGKWQYFLNSLATVGGNLFLLSVFVIGLLVMTFHMLHNHETGDAATVISTTFSGFAGALLAALRGRTTDTNPAPGGGTTSATTTTQTTTVPPTP